MRTLNCTQLGLLGLLLLLCSCGPALPEPVELAYNALPDELDYNIHVKPVLSDKCFHCHGPDAANRSADLRLDEPGHVDGPEIIARILSDDPDYVMPKAEAKIPMSDHEKAVLVKWIEDGAGYKPHWAFEAPVRHDPPAVDDPAWDKQPIDRFVLAKLREKGFDHAPEAPRNLLLRRLSFDLTGLPPTPAEIAAFENDTEPGAYERQVDRLLASPHYGERMAVQWLDLARYADTHGYTVDRYRDMSPWRDWVIRNLNENKPYDQFVTEQLAGDLLPDATRDQVLATGFNRNHPQNLEGGIIEEEFRVAYVADRTETMGTGLLGLTLGCAKCHDHKFDPISQKEYFSFTSFFDNVEEAGLIPWDGATPSPRLALPTGRQDSIIAHLKQLERGMVQTLDNIGKNSAERVDEWIAAGGYRNLKPSPGKVAHFPLEGNLANALRPAQRGRMDRQFSNDERPVFTEGKRGRGLKFDGDAWLDLKPVGIYSRDVPFSIGVTVKLPADLERGYIFHKAQSTRLHAERGYHVKIDSTGLEMLMAHANPGNSILEHATVDLPRNEWVQITMTYDGSSRASGLRLYLNGRELPTEVRNDDLTKDIIFHDMVDDIYPEPIEPGLQLGAVWRGTGIKGASLDDVLVFEHELSPLEVLRLAQPEAVTALTRKAPDDLNQEERDLLAGYYRAVEHSGLNKGRRELQLIRQELVDTMDQVQEIMVLRESPEPRQTFVLDRGQYDAPTDSVASTTPDWLMPFPEGAPRNRLGLAQWMFQPGHPLTARVAVNRYWLQFFGRGLVRTAEDFGNQGELPTHPKLLDWLATEYERNGWDTKALLKTIVMSQTYRQDSRTDEDTRRRDTKNVWLARGPSRRLSAEMIRDNALAASGLLNERIGGKSIKPYQPEGLWKMNNATYVQDEGDNLYRRSLYVFWKRTVPHPTLGTFDAPDRNECTVRRQETNTPLQALVLMNDPAYVEAARILGTQITEAPNKDRAIAEIFTHLSGRPPVENEIDVLRQIRDNELETFSNQPAKASGWLETGFTRAPDHLDPNEVAADAVLASVMLNSDAVITKR